MRKFQKGSISFEIYFKGMGTLEEEVPHLLETFGGIYYYNYNGHLFTVFPSPQSTQVQTENS